MNQITVMDDTFLLGKDGGNGQVWSGCLPLCSKVVQVKPATTIKQVRDAFGTHSRTVAMVHDEPGVDCDLTTKAGIKAAVKVNSRIGSELVVAFPGVSDRPWYCPPHEHQAAFDAWRGGKRAWAAKKKADADRAANLKAAGFPGKGVTGVFVDLYDYEFMADCFNDRSDHEIGIWQALGVDVIPIVFPRFKDTDRGHGLWWTETMAEQRIRRVAAKCKNRVCIFQDVGPGEQPMKMRDWPYLDLITRLAKGN